MSVYINMEMPTKGCRLILVHADGTVQTASGETTAVSVPPHGRLIDADALKDLYHHSIHNSDIDTAWICTIRRSIDNAPTIIEAEE